MNLRVFWVAALTTVLACSPLAGQDGVCPSVAQLREYRPPEASHVLARDGSLVTHLSPQRRVVLAIDSIPALVRNGYVAVEDRRFWSHGGVDLRGIARAAWRDLTSLSLREGSSTITMQLVRQLFPEELPMSEKLRRKACELVLATQVEKQLSKREILALYLNQIYLGDGLYGVEAAAQGYFGKSVGRLTLPEAAVLIALAKYPVGADPRRNSRFAIERRNIVLSVLEREGVIGATDARAAKAAPLRLAPPRETPGGAMYFVAAVRRELQQRFGKDAEIQGLRVHTGLDPVLQRAARDALVSQIRHIEAGAHGRYPHARPPDGPLPAAGDSASPYLQGGLLALDARTGEVRALVAGRDFGHSQFDRMFQARRQPGSAFKPIVYAAALNQGLPITARVETTPITITEVGSPPWRPGDHIATGIESLTLRDAVALSSNYAAVRVGRWAGENRVIEMARALGISARIPAYPSIHLGAADVVPAELVAAYAALANGGYSVRPQLITRVEDKRGRVLWRAPSTHERVVDEGVAFLTVSLLEDVLDRGTGRSIREMGFWLPAAGKTGTTNEGKDAWFVGMTPDLVAGVWLGFDRPKAILPSAGGALLAAPAWGAFMIKAYESRPAPQPWIAPASVVSVPVDTASGLAATSRCPPQNMRIEHFLPGTEPTEYCPLHPQPGLERLLDRLWQGIRQVF